MSDSSDTEYKVGYCKPPLKSRWKKGAPSPNPAGRPRRRPVASYTELVDNLMDERFEVTVKGSKRKISFAEAMAINFRNQAVSGDPEGFKSLQSLRKWGPKILQAAVEQKEQPIRFTLVFDEEEERLTRAQWESEKG